MIEDSIYAPYVKDKKPLTDESADDDTAE